MSETSSLCVLVHNKTLLELYINGSLNILQKYLPDIREICMTDDSFYTRGYQVGEKINNFLDVLEEGNDKYGIK